MPIPDDSDSGSRDSTDGTSMSDATEFLKRRTMELKAGGLPHLQASIIAQLEWRITRWPVEWGDELHILIYGDFLPPPSTLHYTELGITVEADKVQTSFIKFASCVLNARVTVTERTVVGLMDAVDRINALLGVYFAVTWGNVGYSWWSSVIHGQLFMTLSFPFEPKEIDRALEGGLKLGPDVWRHTKAAMFWIRQPKGFSTESYRSDVLHEYAGYWNAFECLVEAVCILRPQTKIDKLEKQRRIDKYIEDRHGKLTAAEVAECYQSIVNPGFVGKAEHALRICFPALADRYIDECFKAKPSEDRLYDIRNAINHGTIEAGNVRELARVEEKRMRLWMIVFGMLGQIIPFRRPVDLNPTAVQSGKEPVLGE